MNEEKTDNIEKIEEENKKEEKKDGFFKAIGKIIVTNPMLLVPMISGLTSALFGGVRMIANKKSQNDIGCYVKDDVTELRYLTTHPLVNQEIKELSERKIAGETTGEALDNMGLLRNERVRRVK